MPSLDSWPARALKNGVSAMAINAEATADVKAMAKAANDGPGAAQWDNATVTAIAAAADLNGWGLRLKISSPTGNVIFDETVEAAGAAVGITAATGILTLAGIPADGDTVTIGSTVYTWETGAVDAAFKVKAETSAAVSLVHLVKAINLTGVEGTDYGAGTTIHPTVSAADGAGDTVDLTAKTLGTAGNSIATTEVGANTSFGAATLTGGADGTDVLSSLASLMMTALNATADIAGAAFTSSTNVLTVAAASDVLGDHLVEAIMVPPDAEENDVGVPGFVTSITDGGLASAALSVDFAADNYAVPKVFALLGAAT
jgi:hypothetical protein